MTSWIDRASGLTSKWGNLLFLTLRWYLSVFSLWRAAQDCSREEDGRYEEAEQSRVSSDRKQNQELKNANKELWKKVEELLTENAFLKSQNEERQMQQKLNIKGI